MAPKEDKVALYGVRAPGKASRQRRVDKQRAARALAVEVQAASDVLLGRAKPVPTSTSASSSMAIAGSSAKAAPSPKSLAIAGSSANAARQAAVLAMQEDTQQLAHVLSPLMSANRVLLVEQVVQQESAAIAAAAAADAKLPVANASVPVDLDSSDEEEQWETPSMSATAAAAPAAAQSPVRTAAEEWIALQNAVLRDVTLAPSRVGLTVEEIAACRWQQLLHERKAPK